LVMILALILSVASTTILVFFAGYRLAMHHHKMQFIELAQEGDSLEPIFAALDREYAYTEELTKPLTDGK
jgi:hypothetical protein